MTKKKMTDEEFRKKLIQEFELTYEELVEYKRYKKSPVVIIKDGETIEIPPKETPLIPTHWDKSSN